MPRLPLDADLVCMTKEARLCYTDRNYPLKFSEEHFEKALQETRSEHPGRNVIFWDACRIEARKKVKADLRRERVRQKKKQEAKENLRTHPRSKKWRLRESGDKITWPLF